MPMSSDGPQCVCGATIWRDLPPPGRMGWPRPEAVFWANGTAWCGSCHIGRVGIEDGLGIRAADRYPFCYSQQYGEWLGAWLADQVTPIDVAERDRVLTIWAGDRLIAADLPPLPRGGADAD